MTTWTAFTVLPEKARAERLGEALERLDPAPMGVIEIEDGSGQWEVGGYFTEPPDPAGLALLEAAFGAPPFVVSEVPDTDWVAEVRRQLTPVVAGRFVVHGSHDTDRLPEGRIPLLIDAAMAFGTGHHGTTQGCLRALDRLEQAGCVPGSVADVGCGTAVLAMAAAHLWPQARILASDIDPQAVETARANLAANGLSERVAVVEAAGLDHPAHAQPEGWDLILANILKGPLLELAPSVADRLSPGGRVVLSGLLRRQVDEVLDAYGRRKLAEDFRIEIGDWATLVLARR